MKLSYPGKVTLEDVGGRIMGPDAHGGYAIATDVQYQAEVDKTWVIFRPALPPDLAQGAFGYDRWGQAFKRADS